MPYTAHKTFGLSRHNKVGHIIFSSFDVRILLNNLVEIGSDSGCSGIFHPGFKSFRYVIMGSRIILKNTIYFRLN